MYALVFFWGAVLYRYLSSFAAAHDFFPAQAYIDIFYSSLQAFSLLPLQKQLISSLLLIKSYLFFLQTA